MSGLTFQRLSLGFCLAVGRRMTDSPSKCSTLTPCWGINVSYSKRIYINVKSDAPGCFLDFTRRALYSDEQSYVEINGEGKEGLDIASIT